MQDSSLFSQVRKILFEQAYEILTGTRLTH